jgi:hypothetical protein
MLLGCAESIILSADSPESIILSAHAESILISAPPAESMILSAGTECIILSAGGAKSIMLSARHPPRHHCRHCHCHLRRLALLNERSCCLLSSSAPALLWRCPPSSNGHTALRFTRKSKLRYIQSILSICVLFLRSKAF